MPLSNAEKQARFRKKDELHKHVLKVSRDCQFLASSRLYLRRTLGDVDLRLREAASLPKEWTEQDLELAYARIRNIYGDVVGAVDLLSEDIKAARDSLDPLIDSPSPKKWLAEQQAAERNAIALAGHLVSALDLSGLPNEERAAAVVETLRHVGRSLGNSATTGRSNATAVCISAVNRHYDRPEWFVDEMVSWLDRNLDEELRVALGKRLLKPAEDHGDDH